jgi:hypothetical protein
MLVSSARGKVIGVWTINAQRPTSNANAQGLGNQLLRHHHHHHHLHHPFWRTEGACGGLKSEPDGHSNIEHPTAQGRRAQSEHR